MRLKTLLVLAAAVPAAWAQTPSQSSTAPASEPVTNLQAFTVTGTNLRAGESAGAANLRVMAPVEIDEAATGSLVTLLRKVPEAGANGFAENRVNTSSPGTASVSLRGLGANSTLVLLNGRRITPAPFAQGGSAASLGTISFVDLNMIPVDALGRVEILKDGASAIYGADAVAGVVNLILRDNVEGLTLRGSFGDYHGPINSPITRASAYYGTKLGGTKLFVLANYFHQAAIRYGELAPKAIALSNGNNPGTFVVPVGGINPITGQVIPAGTAAAARTFTTSQASTTATPLFTTASATDNRFNINEALSPQPRATRYGGLFTASHDFTSTLSGYLELNAQRTTNFETLSPVAISNLNSITLPANAVYNPFRVEVANNPSVGATLIYRFTEAGPRVTKTRNEFNRVVAGAKGRIFQTWDWDVSALYNRSTSHNDLVSGWISQSAVNRALADPNPSTALNLFTNGIVTNNPATIAAITSHGTRDAYTELASGNAKATGSVYTLPAGDIALATGVEVRSERYRDRRTQDQLLNQGPPVPQARGSRRVQAVYVEANTPITSAAQKILGLYSLEVNLAGRAEHYSDPGFSNTAVPRLGARWQPVDEQVTFRAAWGRGYRAPSLAELYQPQSATVAFNIADPTRLGRPGSTANDTNTGQRIIVSGGNPNLSPEKSSSYNYGVLFQPKALSGVSLSVDYFRTEVRNRVGQPATPAIILANPTLFPGFIVRAPQTASDIANNLPGELIQINTVTGNYGTAKTTGLDVTAEYRVTTERLGRFAARATASTIYHQIFRTRPDVASVETVGTYEFPRLRGSGSVEWNYQKVGIATTVDYVGGYADAPPSTTRVKQQAITGLRLSYDFPAQTLVTLGATNLFDRDPPRTASSTGYAESTGFFLARFLYVEVTKKF